MKIAILLLLLLTGCSGNEWVMKREPTTDDERRQVAAHEALLLSHIPTTLSGHDQDWDDAIKAAHNVAVDTWCRDRLYEYHTAGFFENRSSGYTGNIKEVK